jgi:hypothetical protein
LADRFLIQRRFSPIANFVGGPIFSDCRLFGNSADSTISPIPRFCRFSDFANLPILPIPRSYRFPDIAVFANFPILPITRFCRFPDIADKI